MYRNNDKTKHASKQLYFFRKSEWLKIFENKVEFVSFFLNQSYESTHLIQKNKLFRKKWRKIWRKKSGIIFQWQEHLNQNSKEVLKDGWRWNLSLHLNDAVLKKKRDCFV